MGERRVRRCEGESGGGEVNFSDGDALALSGSTVIKMRRVMDCCGQMAKWQEEPRSSSCSVFTPQILIQLLPPVPDSSPPSSPSCVSSCGSFENPWELTQRSHRLGSLIQLLQGHQAVLKMFVLTNSLIRKKRIIIVYYLFA